MNIKNYKNLLDNPDIANYTDYRLYFKDFIEYKRSTSKGFSIRQFCRRAGLSTDNYLLRIIRNERNLGPILTEKFIHILALKNLQAEYFRALVYKELAKKYEDKERYLGLIESIRKKFKKKANIVDNSCFRHWYIGAIWELASCGNGFILTPKSARDALKKRVSVQQAKETIEFLMSESYLVKKNGRLIQSDSPITSTDGISDVIVKINHKETLNFAIDSIALPVEERGFYGLTIAINKKRFSTLKEKLKKFIFDIQTEFRSDPDADTVYRINAHCFPMASTKD